MTQPRDRYSDWDPLEDLDPMQREQMEAYRAELIHYNRRVNLVSQGGEDDFLRRHVAHSLYLTYRSFPESTTVVDWGTGGGLPGIPLAIRFPQTEFVLVDSVGKKVASVRAITARLGLTNVRVWHGRAQDWPGRATHSVSRATASLSMLWSWHVRIADAPDMPVSETDWPPGLICLKGGDLEQEVDELRSSHAGLHVAKYPIAEFTGEPLYAGKYIVLVTSDQGDRNHAA